MGTPEIVRRQAEAAEQRIAEIAAGNTGKPAPAVSEPAPQPAQPAAVVEPAPAPNALDEAKKDAESWKQRYTVLQGKSNNEVPRLTRELQEANDKIADLTAQLNAKATPPLSDADREALSEKFGADMVDMVIGLIQQGVKKEVDPLREKAEAAAQLARENAAAAKKTETQIYWEKVDSLLAAAGLEFEQTNNDPGFIAWLGEADGLSGFKRHDSLEKAQSDRDAERTAQFFIAYAKGLPKGDATSLESQIQPPVGGGGVDVLDPHKGKKIWTRADIEQFYVDKRKGVYRGKDQEADRIEADIFAARREGRIR